MADEKVDIYFPFYVGDYDRDTADLSFEEHGFYGAILRALWVRNGVLDGRDRPRLARILRTDAPTIERLWPSVERFFTANADGTFHQKRLTYELEKAKRLKAEASRAGQASAEARRNKTGTAQPARTPPRTDVERSFERPSEQPPEHGPERAPNSSESESPSESESDPPSESPALSGARGVWTPHDWWLSFGRAWCGTYGGVSYGAGASDGKAQGDLGDLLRRLTGPERKAAQDRASAMFAEFLADRTDQKVVNSRHAFVFFVHRFNGLRVPQLPLARGSPPRDPKVGRIAAPGPEHKYPKGDQAL